MKIGFKALMLSMALAVAGSAFAGEGAECDASKMAAGDKAACAAACAEKGMDAKDAAACAEKCAAGTKVVQAGLTDEKGAAAPAYKLGSKVSDFELKNASTGENSSLSSVAGKIGTVVVFWNQTCPFVVECQDRVTEFAKTYSEKGVNVVAIDAGVNNKPEQIAEYAKTRPFTLLVNDDSSIAAKFAATNTPHVFFLDKDMNVVYTGAFDSGSYKNDKGERDNYVQAAADSLIKGEKVAKAETKAFGCSLKYAKGVKPQA